MKDWKARVLPCKSCNRKTKHAYSNETHDGIRTTILICRICEDTDIKHFRKKRGQYDKKRRFSDGYKYRQIRHGQARIYWDGASPS